jgi:hypothetical protein
MGAMRTAFLNAITEEDVAKVAQWLLNMALGGDVEAARLFLSYALGKPAAVVEPDELNIHEISLLFRTPPLDLGTMVRYLVAPKSVEAMREEVIMDAENRGILRRLPDEDDEEEEDASHPAASRVKEPRTAGLKKGAQQS